MTTTNNAQGQISYKDKHGRNFLSPTLTKTLKKVRHYVSITTLTVAFSQSAFAQNYQASTVDKPLKIVNITELEKEASKSMEKGAFGYVRGGAENEQSLRENTDSFDKKYIEPRILAGLNAKDIDITTSLFGIPLSIPIIQAPMAAHGLAHVDGELATARGMIQAGSIPSLSTYGNKTIEEVAQATGAGNPFFFQLYMSKNDAFNCFTIDRAKKSGAKAIILTVDAPVGGYREDDVRNDFKFPLGFANLEAFLATQNDGTKSGEGSGISEIFAQAKQNFTPEDITYVKKLSGLPVIVKGVQSPKDVDIAIKAGADAIWVSNHGGRQLGSAPATIDILPAIAKKVNKRVPIIFDGGVRRGSHVFKALASGADIVAVGRPIFYGLHLGGAQGVNSVMDLFKKELSINMMLAGTRNIKAVQKSKLLTEANFK